MTKTKSISKGDQPDKSESNIFSVSFAIGLVVFLLAESIKGGMTGLEGFIVGFMCSYFVYIVLVYIGS